MANTTTTDQTHAPVLRVTRYDVVSSGMMAVLIALGASFILLTATWYATRVPPRPAAIPVEIVEISGGAEDGAVGETLRVDAPAPEAADASNAQFPSEANEIQETFDSVLELANEAVSQTERQFEMGTRNSGKVASAKGTGRRGLGVGPGSGGIPREQRWFVRYADQQTIEEYGRQLDYFEVELGTIKDGKLLYLSKLSAPRPTVRSVDSGASEQRLYLTWQGGARKSADLQLFQRAGIDVGSGVIFQFYAKATENQLARLELDYKNRKAEEIRRTYFVVNRTSAGYEFAVSNQTYVK
jgi:hypothetical protein